MKIYPRKCCKSRPSCLAADLRPQDVHEIVPGGAERGGLQLARVAGRLVWLPRDYAAAVRGAQRGEPHGCGAVALAARAAPQQAGHGGDAEPGAGGLRVQPPLAPGTAAAAGHAKGEDGSERHELYSRPQGL